LGDECVNRANLDALAPAEVSPTSSFDVIIDFGCDDGQQREITNDSFGGSRTMESLKQFLQHDARGNHGVASSDGALE
jgi:hypothetical protein